MSPTCQIEYTVGGGALSYPCGRESVATCYDCGAKFPSLRSRNFISSEQSSRMILQPLSSPRGLLTVVEWKKPLNQVDGTIEAISFVGNPSVAIHQHPGSEVVEGVALYARRERPETVASLPCLHQL